MLEQLSVAIDGEHLGVGSGVQVEGFDSVISMEDVRTWLREAALL